MDWRHRDYYLVKISSEARHMRDEILKEIGVKFHAPYGHFAAYPFRYDGLRNLETGILSPCYMLSCRKEDSEAVEYELRKAVRNDLCSRFFKLSKEVTWQ